MTYRDLSTDVKELKNSMKVQAKTTKSHKTESDNIFKSADERLRAIEKGVTELRSTQDTDEVNKRIDQATKKFEENSGKRHLEYTFPV